MGLIVVGALLVTHLAVAQPPRQAGKARAPRTGAWKHLPDPLATFPGGTIWQTTLPAVPAFPPAFDATRTYVILRDGTCVAVALETGLTDWVQPITATLPPAAAAGRVVIADTLRLRVIDAATGHTLWTATLPTAAGSLAMDASDVLVATTDGTVVAFAAASGLPRWQAPLASPVTAPLALTPANVYAGLADGRVVAINRTTGTNSWSRTLTGRVQLLTALDQRVCVGTDAHVVALLDARDGDVDWRWRTSGDAVGDAAVDARHLYYVALDNTLRAHRRSNGNLEWTQPLSARPVGGPLWLGDRLVVGSVAPELRGFSVIDGASAGVVSTPGRLLHRPVLVPASGDQPARIVIVTRGGQIHAIGQTIEPAIVALETLPGQHLRAEVLPPVVR